MHTSEPYLVRPSEEVSSYVLRRSLAARELPSALAGLRHTSEMRALVAISAVAVGLAGLGLPVAAATLVVCAAAWAATHAAGRVVGLGLYRDGRLVGGLRMRHHGRRRTVTIMGLYVEPSHRRSGAAKLLLAEALTHARELLGPRGSVVAYAPTHPASRRLVDVYLRRRRLRVGSPEFSAAVAELRL